MTSLNAAAHVHSDWSYDGHWALSRIASSFAVFGYNAVLMSEHDRGFDESSWQAYRSACHAATSPRMLVVPGIEYSDATNCVHVLVWGVDHFLGEGRETGALLRDVAEQGGFAVLAHPSRKMTWQRVRKDWVELLGGIEIWNRKTDGCSPSANIKGLVESESLSPFVGLDFHHARQLFPMNMRLRAAAHTQEGVYDALRGGAFRAEVLGISAPQFLSGKLNATVSWLEARRRHLVHVRGVLLGTPCATPLGAAG